MFVFLMSIALTRDFQATSLQRSDSKIVFLVLSDY